MVVTMRDNQSFNMSVSRNSAFCLHEYSAQTEIAPILACSDQLIGNHKRE